MGRAGVTKGGCQHRHAQGARGDGEGETVGPGEVGGRRLRAEPEFAAILLDALVGVAATEGDAQRPGECRLDHSAVGARMPSGLFTDRTDGVRRTTADEGRGGHGETAGDPGGNPVGQVVQLRCGPAEVAVALVAIAHHRVQGVDGPVPQQPGDAGDRPPEQWRHHCVGRVLGHRLQRCPGDAVRVQRLGVAADQVAHPVPGGGQVVVDQVRGDRFRRPGQRTPTEHGPGGRGRRDHAEHGMAPRHSLGDQSRAESASDRDRPEGGATGPAVPVAALLQCGREPSEPGHGVPATWITQQLVGQPAQRQPAGEDPRPLGHGQPFRGGQSPPPSVPD